MSIFYFFNFQRNIEGHRTEDFNSSWTVPNRKVTFFL